MISKTNINEFKHVFSYFLVNKFYIILSSKGVNCKSILNLKRKLNLYNINIKFFKNTYTKLILRKLNTKFSNIINHQCMFIFIKNDSFEVYNLIHNFINTHDLKIIMFIYNNNIVDIECIKMLAKYNNINLLKKELLFRLKYTLNKFVSILNHPLRNFVYLIQNKLNFSEENVEH